MAAASVNVKNLEQIQETEPNKPPTRLTALLLASLAGTALVLAGLMMTGREAPVQQTNADPLAQLVLKAKNDGVPAHRLDAEEVTFPELLSDVEKPTTALAAVKDERGGLVKHAGETVALGAAAPGTAPPPATDRLPVVPLPAGTLLNATPVTTQPKDDLSKLAVNAAAARVNAATEAPAGADSGFQIQVASFKEQVDADAFVSELRKRGHEAFRVAAMIPGRGLWHRVRVGPFKTKYQAVAYKQKFEQTERMAPFVIDPEKIKQAEEIRQRKLEVRMKKYGEP
ncbi:MAG TPA: SPOR domain-containing protein [Polyangiaceae bacterium]|nr:SPOR domain-containing protein [Polyangiaceae bacterium]